MSLRQSAWRSRFSPIRMPKCAQARCHFSQSWRKPTIAACLALCARAGVGAAATPPSIATANPVVAMNDLEIMVPLVLNEHRPCETVV
jgi:hypothetical protein